MKSATRSRLILCLLISPLMLPAAGCKNYGNRIPVAGQVTLDGEPVREGTVAFVGQEGYVVASGVIRNGHYELSESTNLSGIPIGEYKVKFEIWKEAPGQELPNGKFSKGITAIPEKYHNSDQSGVTASVSKKARTFNFDIQSK